MTVVLFGTGTDYVLFVSARFREELSRHADKHEAMRRTMRGVGGAVASADTTILIRLGRPSARDAPLLPVAWPRDRDRGRAHDAGRADAGAGAAYHRRAARLLAQATAP